MIPVLVSITSPSKVAVKSPVAVTMPTFCSVTVNVTWLPGVVSWSLGDAPVTTTFGS